MKETTTTAPPVANKRGRKPGKKSSDKVDIRAKLGNRNRVCRTSCGLCLCVLVCVFNRFREEQAKCPWMSCKEKITVPVFGRTSDWPRKGRYCSEARTRQGNDYIWGLFFLHFLSVWSMCFILFYFVFFSIECGALTLMMVKYLMASQDC